MGVPPQRKSWLRLCKLSQKFRTLHFNGHVDYTKRSKIVAIRHISWTRKAIKIAFAAGALPRTPLGSLQRSPDPVVAFKGSFTVGRGKGRQKGRGREEKGGRKGEGSPKVRWICQLGGTCSIASRGIDAPVGLRQGATEGL